MEKWITLEKIMYGCTILGVAHLIANTGDAHPYIAGGIVLFGLVRLEDFLKKNLTS